jgi:hypothetical protein
MSNWPEVTYMQVFEYIGEHMEISTPGILTWDLFIHKSQYSRIQ